MEQLERAVEFTILSSLLDNTAQGNGGVAVVVGPPGSGKTTLMSAFAKSASSHGIEVETAALPRFAQTLPVEFSARRDTAPRLLCIDDLHNADVEALRTISRLTLAIRSEPVLLVLGLRPTQQHAHQEVLAELGDQPHCRTLRLEQLSADGVMRLGARQFGLTLSSGTATELLRLAGGNLALLKGLLADFRRLQERLTTADPVSKVPGTAYHKAVLSCYYRFEAEVREVAQAIAVLGEYSTARSLAEVSGTTQETAARALTALTSAGLLSEGYFRHPVAADAVLSSIPVQRVTALRRRSACVLRTMGAPAVEVARLLIAADHTDPTWTDFLAQEAATQALALDDRELAVSTMRLSLRGMTDDARRAKTLIRIAETHAASNPELCAQCLHEAGALIGIDVLWQRRSSLLGEQMARRGWAAEAVDRLDALAGRLDAEQEAERMELETDRLLVLGDYPSLTGTSGAPAEPDRAAECSASSARFGAAWSLVRMLKHDRPDPAAVRAASEGLYASAFTEQAAPAAVAALSALLYAKELDVVHSLTDKLVDEAVMRRAPVWQARLLAIRAEAYLCEGRYADAVKAAQRAVAMMSPQAWGARIGGPLASVMLGSVMTGDLVAARSRLEQSVPAAVFDSRHGLRYLFARGHVNLADGRTHAALADFVTCGRLMAAWGVDHEHVLPWRLAAAGAQLARGDQEAAVDLIDQRNERLGASEPRTGADDGHRSAREQVFAALAGAVEGGDLIEGIRLLMVDEPSPPPWSSTARYRIEDRFSRYLNKLTFSERKVAMLAATGNTNRIIARSLSLSISTVEQHLTHTYKKLGLAGRQELRAKLG